MNASSWKRAADQIAQQTQVIHQIESAATTDSNQLDSLPLSPLAADDSDLPEIQYHPEWPLIASTPRAITTPIGDTQSIDPYHQIIPGMSQHLYSTITPDSSLNTSPSDNGHTLHDQITTEFNKYLQEAAEKHEAEDKLL